MIYLKEPSSIDDSQYCTMIEEWKKIDNQELTWGLNPNNLSYLD